MGRVHVHIGVRRLDLYLQSAVRDRMRGSGASEAWLGCVMRLTGEQAFYLRSQLVQM